MTEDDQTFAVWTQDNRDILRSNQIHRSHHQKRPHSWKAASVPVTVEHNWQIEFDVEVCGDPANRPKPGTQQYVDYRKAWQAWKLKKLSRPENLCYRTDDGRRLA